MLLSLYLAALCAAVGHVSAAVYGEHEKKGEAESYLLYDVSVKYGKGDLNQAYEVLSELNLGQAYKLVGEARAIFQVADKHTCQDHIVDIPDAHVEVQIARPLEALADDFNITLNNTNDKKYLDDKYLTLIEVTYEDNSNSSGASEALEKIVEGFVAVHSSTDCDHCIVGYYIVGSRPIRVIYIANVKPKDVFELYETLGLNGGNVIAQAHRLVNFHSYLQGKATQCDAKDTAHAAASNGLVYTKPTLGYGQNVHNTPVHADNKQGSGYDTKKGLPVYDLSNQHAKLPNYNILGNGNGNSNFGNYKPLGSKHPGFAIPKPIGYGNGKPTGYGDDTKSTGYSDDKPKGYGEDKPTDDKKTYSAGDNNTGKKSADGVKKPSQYQAQQDRFYSGYNIPKHGGFIAPNSFNLGSKDHLFVF